MVNVIKLLNSKLYKKIHNIPDCIIFYNARLNADKTYLIDIKSHIEFNVDHIKAGKLGPRYELNTMPLTTISQCNFTLTGDVNEN